VTTTRMSELADALTVKCLCWMDDRSVWGPNMQRLHQLTVLDGKTNNAERATAAAEQKHMCAITSWLRPWAWGIMYFPVRVASALPSGKAWRLNARR
jgi:hypothetical protein